MRGYFDREGLLRLLDEVSEELRWSRTRAQIYVIGGAAMSLAYARERQTEDVDARIDEGHQRLTQAVRTVGRRHGLPDAWLNDSATTAIPREPDRAARTVYASPHLTVSSASPKHLLAMKLYAAREKDHQDIRTLMRIADIHRAGDAVAIYERLFPKEPLKERARDILREITGQEP